MEKELGQMKKEVASVGKRPRPKKRSKIIVKGKKDIKTFDMSEDGNSISFTMESKKENRKVTLKRIK